MYDTQSEGEGDALETPIPRCGSRASQFRESYFEQDFTDVLASRSIQLALEISCGPKRSCFNGTWTRRKLNHQLVLLWHLGNRGGMNAKTSTTA